MKNKRKTLAIVLGVVTVITMIMLTSYAIWKVSEKQSGSNLVVGGCLKIEFQDVGASGFTLQEAWPISDEDGTSSSGYTFAIVNTCPKPVDYQVVLDQIIQGSAVAEDQFDTHYVKTQTDNGVIKRYDLLAMVDIEQPDDNAHTVLDSRNIANGTVPGATNEGPGRVEHNIKLWISEDAPNEQINKNFDSKVKIYAGQGITKGEYKVVDASCFESITPNGYAIGYDYDKCGTDVVMPAMIDGVLLTKFGYTSVVQTQNSSFKDMGKALSSLDISGMYGLKEIENQAFNDYNSSKELIIPNSVEIIGWNAFASYNGEKIVLPESLKTIEYGAFYHYEGVNDDLVIPNSVTTIGSQAFQNYNGKSLTISESLTSIDQMTFSNYEGINDDLVIPNSVTTIGLQAFQSFNGESLTLSQLLTSIHSHAFSTYNGSDITIPSTITSIGHYAFNSMDNTKTIYVNKPSLSGIELGTNWNGQATVKCLVAQDTYEVCQ